MPQPLEEKFETDLEKTVEASINPLVAKLTKMCKNHLFDTLKRATKSKDSKEFTPLDEKIEDLIEQQTEILLKKVNGVCNKYIDQSLKQVAGKSKKKKSSVSSDDESSDSEDTPPRRRRT